jgi:hypothetical protein
MKHAVVVNCGLAVIQRGTHRAVSGCREPAAGGRADFVFDLSLDCAFGLASD